MALAIEGESEFVSLLISVAPARRSCEVRDDGGWEFLAREELRALPRVDTLFGAASRYTDTPERVRQYSAMANMLWSDASAPEWLGPPERPGLRTHERLRHMGTVCGWGPSCSERFCSEREYDGLLRGHDAVKSGFARTHDGRVLTVHSVQLSADSVAAFARWNGGHFEKIPL